MKIFFKETFIGSPNLNFNTDYLGDMHSKCF